MVINLTQSILSGKSWWRRCTLNVVADHRRYGYVRIETTFDLIWLQLLLRKTTEGHRGTCYQVKMQSYLRSLSALCDVYCCNTSVYLLSLFTAQICAEPELAGGNYQILDTDSLSSSLYTYGNVVVISCDRGYSMQDGSDGYTVLVCNEHGDWTPDPFLHPACQFVSWADSMSLVVIIAAQLPSRRLRTKPLSCLFFLPPISLCNKHTLIPPLFNLLEHVIVIIGKKVAGTQRAWHWNS